MIEEFKVGYLRCFYGWFLLLDWYRCDVRLGQCLDQREREREEFVCLFVCMLVLYVIFEVGMVLVGFVVSLFLIIVFFVDIWEEVNYSFIVVNNLY